MSAISRCRFSKDADRGVVLTIYFNGFHSIFKTLNESVTGFDGTRAIDPEALESISDDRYERHLLDTRVRSETRLQGTVDQVEDLREPDVIANNS